MSLELNRRSFLRGAGCLMPLPFLNLMAASEKKANGGKPPMRFMSLFKPNGVHPPSWNISGGSEFDFKMAPMMKPFEKHKKDLLILDNMGDFGFSSHTNATRRFLSGHHKNTRSASVDQLIADKIGGTTPVRSLELTTEGLFTNQIGCSYISYDRKGQPIPRNSDPQIVFDQLFRNPMSHPSKRKEMTSLLDRVSDDAKSLEKKAGKEDREVLDEYFTVVREAEKRLHNLKNSSKPKVDFSKLKRPEAGGNMNEQVETMLDLVALALWTDSTRCVSYMLGNSNSRMVFDFLGIKEQHHYLSHFFRNFSRSNIDGLLKISLWHMEKFNYLLNRLKSYRDQNGSLLDHTLVHYGSGMGHSDNHTATRIPTILAGGKGLIKTGRYVRYAENQQLGKLHLALLNKFGIESSSFGNNSTPLMGLSDSNFKRYVEKKFDSWVKVDKNQITVQGRLRLSDDLNEAKIFYVDYDNGKSVKVSVAFGDFHKFNLAYHCGTGITLKGNGSNKSGQLVISKVTELKSIFGKKPGSAGG